MTIESLPSGAADESLKLAPNSDQGPIALYNIHSRGAVDVETGFAGH